MVVGNICQCMAGGWEQTSSITQRQAPGAWGAPPSPHLQPGQHRHDLSRVSCRLRPVGFICLLAASPLTDLQMLCFQVTLTWSPSTPHTGTCGQDFTHHLWVCVSSPDANIQLQYLLQLKMSKTECMCLHLFPPNQLPLSLLHLRQWHHHPSRLQPCNQPYSSLSPHCHILSNSTHGFV